MILFWKFETLKDWQTEYPRRLTQKLDEVEDWKFKSSDLKSGMVLLKSKIVYISISIF